jgi:hypothetical protein
VSHTQPRIMAVALVLLVSCVAVLTFTLSPTARLIPIYVVVPTFVLLLLNLVLEYRPRPSVVTSTFEKPKASGDEVVRPHEGRVLMWVLLLPVLTWLLGLAPAVGLYNYLYARRWLDSSRTTAALASLCLAVGLSWMSLVATAHGPLDGWLWPMVGIR